MSEWEKLVKLMTLENYKEEKFSDNNFRRHFLAVNTSASKEELDAVSDNDLPLMIKAYFLTLESQSDNDYEDLTYETILVAISVIVQFLREMKIQKLNLFDSPQIFTGQEINDLYWALTEVLKLDKLYWILTNAADFPSLGSNPFTITADNIVVFAEEKITMQILLRAFFNFFYGKEVQEKKIVLAVQSQFWLSQLLKP
jgi:hypothetical protein